MLLLLNYVKNYANAASAFKSSIEVISRSRLYYPTPSNFIPHLLNISPAGALLAVSQFIDAFLTRPWFVPYMLCFWILPVLACYNCYRWLMLHRPLSVAKQTAINVIFICLEHGNKHWTLVGYLCIIVASLLLICWLIEGVVLGNMYFNPWNGRARFPPREYDPKNFPLSMLTDKLQANRPQAYRAAKYYRYELLASAGYMSVFVFGVYLG